MKPFQRNLWIALAVLAALSPLGILIPRWLNSGSAWGEWNMETIGRMLGYVPEGLKRTSGIWNAPIADYGHGEALWYVVSALIGLAVCAGAVYLLARSLSDHNEK